MWHDTVLGTIGNTPLVRINQLAEDFPCTVLGKVEFFNPGGSVKDRIGISMIEDAEEKGLIEPGGTIIEGTSGNTGAGLAIAAIAKGYRCIFTTTDKQSREKVDVLRGLGAEVLICPTNVEPDDPRSYYSVAQRLAEEIPNSVYLNQYDNPSNPQIHYETTGPELWEQTEGRITHYVAGAGTGGTISGTGRYLKEQQEDVNVIGVDPAGSVFYKYFHEGVFDEEEIYPYFTEGVGEDILPDNMDFDVVDDFVRVEDKEAMQMTRRLAREEGLFIGQSCGMAMAGALQWMEDHRNELTEDDVVVVLLPDSGFRYLSKTYNDEWMRNHGFLESKPDVTADQVLNLRRDQTEVISAAPGDKIGNIIERMTEEGISQMPVIDDDHEVVGSVTETRILNRLIDSPDARDQPVRTIMGTPFPVVPASLHLEHLSAYLEQDVGAVLVDHGSDGGRDYSVLTKSDLISALMKVEQGNNGTS
ncbi:cystathionine beta-synthase [Salinibacter sp. 10B]|uniref:cystathionine beta-synthase n=1 Tax=Salinibacter sp. 10B TaxID=1923971 RepID=UPI000CF3F015|nr:cystathionine beta-synthase [Salinibacter sp. 10B]PQJ36177.1 cystathionine beta-synthase [Salinibacter sp. 10B]